MTPPEQSFSDEDLKEYKYKLENVWAFKGDREKMKALLARLEAAEAVCQQARWFAAQNSPDEHEALLGDSLEAWRKACGK